MKHLFLYFLPLLFATSAWSQLTFTGKVTTERNQMLGNATIVLKNNAIRKAVAASNDGAFTFTGLQKGRYTITITAIGHETFSKAVAIDENFVKSIFTAKLIASAN